MSLDSYSNKPLPKGSVSSFQMEFRANREEFRQLSSDLNALENVYFKGHLAYPELALALPPYEVFFSIIHTVTSIATLVDILYRYLKRKDGDEGEIKFIFNGKEMIIKGNYDKEELEIILKEFTKVATMSKLKLLSEERMRQLKKELKNLEKYIPTYQKLVDIGNERLIKGEEVNLEQHQHYVTELNNMKVRLESIENLLKNG